MLQKRVRNNQILEPRKLKFKQNFLEHYKRVVKNDANFFIKGSLELRLRRKAIKFIEFKETINYATFEVGFCERNTLARIVIRVSGSI